MVTTVNGGLCNGSLISGYHPSERTPKYKIRKVSAVRDFPPGCGPNAPPSPSDLNPLENGANMSNAEKYSVNQPEPIKIPTHEDHNESSDILIETAVSVATDGLISGVEEIKIDVQTLGSELLDHGLGNHAMDMNKPQSQPIKQQQEEEAASEAQVLSMFDRVGEKEKPMAECATSLSTHGTEDCLPPELSFSDSLILEEENSPTPKDKFYKRRVSAVRDFPPLCGPNAPREPKNEPPVANSENMSLFEVTNVKLKSDFEEGTPSVDKGNGTFEATSIDMREDGPLVATLSAGNEELELEGSLSCSEFHKNELERLSFEQREEPETEVDSMNEDNHEFVGKEIVLYSQDNDSYPSDTVVVKGGEVVREVVHGLMADPYCLWRQGKSASSISVWGALEGKARKDNVGWRQRSRAVAKKSTPRADSLERSSTKRNLSSAGKTLDANTGAMIVKDEGTFDARYVEPLNVAPPIPTHGRCDFDVSLPPFGPNSSSLGDARNRVRETLRLFQAICRKLLQGEEAKSGPEGGGISGHTEKSIRRIDLQAAKIIKEKGKEVNTGTHHLGAVPGVEVGDEFQYRVELAIVGLHRLYQAGIDYLNRNGTLFATSIVASGAYADDMENADVLVYSGQGGNIVGKNKQPEDQKLERGNLALKNSISQQNPVRVIRGSKEMKASESSDAKDKVVTTYVYDGLYTVERFWTETGMHGKMVFKFELRRIPGQPELAWKQVRLSKKSKKREGVCVDDISGGHEAFPIYAINTVDSEKPSMFTYITKMMYPDWFCPIPPKGCDCTGRCYDSQKCSCAVKNGGEIPYNHNGAIVEAKPLVYECGPSCKCPPSCYNRVSQRGMKIKLEIFKTESRGWGVRSIGFIPSGSFICEYAGELLEDKEAEQRTGNDEYLFDIGRNYNDCYGVDPSDVNEEGGYTIDAAKYGNIGRFINHSCSPNLYAQNVLYDHEDTRMPHIMLFAAENIPALQELTYHYNYSVDQVHDSSGNIKMKSCYCGSAECTGRMY